MSRATAPTSCVLYARSSKDTHDISPATQLKELRAFAATHGYRVVDERQDAAVSANANPPALAQLLRELKDPQRGWNAILAVESSRLARDMNLAGVIAYDAEKAGVRIEYSKMPSSGNAAMDMMIRAIARAWDQYHSMQSKEKGLGGMKTNVELGWRAGGRAPLGYVLKYTDTGAVRQGKPVTKSQLDLDPVWAPRVKRYLQLRIAGRPRKEAARASGLGGKPDTTLIGMERNALVYAGITVWNRHAESGPERYRPRAEWVLKRETHKALIGEAEAEAIMLPALPTARKRSPSGQFLLSGFLFTPSGEAMTASGDDYYRAGKGRRIPCKALEDMVLEQTDDERNSREFMQKFIAEAKRAAAGLATKPADLERERKRIATRLASWVRLAEQEPSSPTIVAELRKLESERDRVEGELSHLAENARLKASLNGLNEREARALLAGWMEEDGTTMEERRAALAQIVDKIEFDPATGTGRIHYRIGLSGAKFALGGRQPRPTGVSWRPHGDSNPGYRRERAMS
jgi:site-specific DNA recombinase